MGTASTFVRTIAVLFLGLSLAACSAISGRETAGEYMDDTSITTKVKSEIIADKYLKATQINVETMQGVVQLSGFVDSVEHERRAVEIAKRQSGVKSVRNDIIVR